MKARGEVVARALLELRVREQPPLALAPGTVSAVERRLGVVEAVAVAGRISIVMTETVARGPDVDKGVRTRPGWPLVRGGVGEGLI